MTLTQSLFEVRGGSLMAHVCESCNDPLPKDSLSPVCEDCLDEQTMEDL